MRKNINIEHYVIMIPTFLTLSFSLYLSLSIYIYIYIYVCVCVSVSVTECRSFCVIVCIYAEKGR